MHSFPRCTAIRSNPPFACCAAWTKALGSDGLGMAVSSSNRAFFTSTFSTFFAAAAGCGEELKIGGGRRSRTPLLRPVDVSLMANGGGRDIGREAGTAVFKKKSAAWAGCLPLLCRGNSGVAPTKHEAPPGELQVNSARQLVSRFLFLFTFFFVQSGLGDQ